MRPFLLSLALIISTSVVFADQLYVAAAATVGVATGKVLNRNDTRTHLELYNQSASNTIYCTFDGTAAVAAETAKQITIPPLAGQVWSTQGRIPPNEINCIATAGSTPLTILQ